MTASVLELTNGTAPTTPTSGLLDVYANSSKALCTIDDAGNVLSAPTLREAETIAVRPQFNAGSSAAPTGTTSATAVMMGLGLVSGFTITPQVSGRIAIWVGGVVLNNTVGDGTSMQGKYGTGTAPSNGAATTGTNFGLLQHFVASTAAGQQGWMCMGNATGLTLNVAVWIDVAVNIVTGGTGTLKDVQVMVFEY